MKQRQTQRLLELGLVVMGLTTSAGLAVGQTATPYVVPVKSGVTVRSILTVGDSVPSAVSGLYRMAGIPDGIGAFDNGDGTFTVLMNHELGDTSGVRRLHGGTGSFVSRWVIAKDTLQVLSGRDQIGTLVLNGSASLNLNRFCSADLPAVTAYYNAVSGLGTTDRIFMNGEETGGGRAFGHVATGASAFTSYELPLLGRFAHENVVASPFAQDKTVVAGLDDTTPQAPGSPSNNGGRVYVYVGQKTASGTPVAKAGLTNGINYAVQVTGVNLETRGSGLAANGPLVTSGAFTLAPSGGTQFQRPEDGAWDPVHPNDFYFATTDRLDLLSDGLGATIGRTRLWRLRFTDITNPTAGGTIEMLLTGTEGPNMLDNLAVDISGRVLLQEDTGGAVHNAKIWMYDIATGVLTQIAKHDPARFGDIGVPAVAPYGNDEESSGVLDVSSIFGEGHYLGVVQAHYAINNANPNGFSNPNELVEGGQLFLLRAPVIDITRGGLVLDRRTATFAQQVTLKNTTSEPISGPIQLALEGLSGNATLVNATGITTEQIPDNVPYITVLGGGATLAPGASVSVVLQFSNPSRTAITYEPRVVISAIP